MNKRKREKSVDRSERKGILLLLLTAAIWGSTFVAQSVGMEHVKPFSFLAIRSFLGAMVLLPVICLLDKKDKGVQKAASRTPKGRKKLWFSGALCGTVLCIASAFQQFGMQDAEPGKAGFITALYILLVPIFGLFLGRKVTLRLWLCVAVAVVGLYLLCVKEGFSFSAGDAPLLICAGWFSVHILLVDRFAPGLDGVRLSFIQFIVMGVISAVLMALLEKPQMRDILAAWLPLAYAGVLSSGVAYTLQIVAQKSTKPTVASLLMSLESAFALLAGMVVLRQIPTLREAIGCALMFAAIIVCQLPTRVKTQER